MRNTLWLSYEDVLKTGVCDLKDTVEIVENAFKMFDLGQGIIAPEAALRLNNDGQDHACYSLPAYIGGYPPVCGLKWTSHGSSKEVGKSRIQASVIINDIATGIPLAVMNGTEIGAARTGAVTALALRYLAPEKVRKVALCGAGGQAERQLQAVLSELPQAEEIDVWSRGNERNHALAERYNKGNSSKIRPVATLGEAVKDADVIIGATSADSPYLTAECVKDASLYCHIGFHEISWEAIDSFSYIVTDTWEEAKNVSGQSLFRFYREGKFTDDRVAGKLGGIISGRISIPRGTKKEKVFFDAFGLPIFDLSVAREAYLRAGRLNLGTEIPW